MKNILTIIFIITILTVLCNSIFAAASASCSALNKRTSQIFSATGEGSTQAAATQDAQNNVMQNCKQSSSSDSDACELGDCSSSQY